MGRLQSSVGLITGTNIVGTVDQLITISARPRDRLQARTESLRQQQGAVNSLTATVIGVQLAGKQLGDSSLFHSRTATSSNKDALSVSAGSSVRPGDYSVKTLASAATHSVSSRQRFEATDVALGLSGKLTVSPDGFLDQSANLADLNDGRGVESGVIRLTDRSGRSAEVDLSQARNFDDVIGAINDADVDIRATTQSGAIKLTDQTGQTVSNLKVEQIGPGETAADLGLWGIDEASNEVSGIELDLPVDVSSLRGTALSQLGGGNGLGTLGSLNIKLSDGSNASIDLSSTSNTSEVIDAIDAAGLDLIVGLNDARNGLRIRDVSGGNENFHISSDDDTAASLGLAADTSSDIVVGSPLNLQTINADTRLADLNQGQGIDRRGFTITDSSGATSAINVGASVIETVGELINKINELSIDVTASLNEAGDGIAIIDGGNGDGTLTIADNGNGKTAADLKIAGTATEQTVGGQTVSAIVGTQADVIEVTETDTLETIVARINEGRYGTASVRANSDGTFGLQVRGKLGGEQGKLAINTSGFDLDLQTNARGQDALISVLGEDGVERFINSTDGVFKLNDTGTSDSRVNRSTSLADLGASKGSFTVTDTQGNTNAVNITVDGLHTVGDLVDKINSFGNGIVASINETGTGITISDASAGDGELEIADAGNGRAAAALGIAGIGTLETPNGGEETIESGVVSIKGVASAGNEVDEDGLVFTLKEMSDEPIVVTVGEDTSKITKAVERFVKQYNTLAEQVKSLTFFDAEANEVGVLFGSSEALRIDSGYSRLLTGQLRGAGDISTLGEVGLRIDSEGALVLDKGKLEEAIGERKDSVVDFFTTEESGLSARLNTLAERLAGTENSLLLTRSQTLQTRIERNVEKVDFYNGRLEVERERLLNQFYSTEEAISKIQGNLSAVQQIQPLQFPE